MSATAPTLNSDAISQYPNNARHVWPLYSLLLAFRSLEKLSLLPPGAGQKRERKRKEGPPPFPLFC